MPRLAENGVSSTTELKRSLCKWAGACDRLCVGPSVDRRGVIHCRNGCMRLALDQVWKRDHPGTELDLP
jgi:hypothetical protein